MILSLACLSIAMSLDMLCKSSVQILSVMRVVHMKKKGLSARRIKSYSSCRARHEHGFARYPLWDDVVLTERTMGKSQRASMAITTAGDRSRTQRLTEQERRFFRQLLRRKAHRETPRHRRGEVRGQCTCGCHQCV